MGDGSLVRGTLHRVPHEPTVSRAAAAVEYGLLAAKRQLLAGWQLLCESCEVALDAAGGDPESLFVELEACDFPSLDKFQDEGVVHAQKLRHFLDGVERFDVTLSCLKAQFLVDVRFHQVREVGVVSSLGEFDRGEPSRVGDVRVGTIGKEQFDHLGRAFVDRLVKRRVPADHAMLTLKGAVLLVWVGPEFKEERDHVGSVEPNGRFQRRLAVRRIFQFVRIGAGIELLSSSGQVVALDRLVQR